MNEITEHRKWCLRIYKEDIPMPTQYHALKLGFYLRSFNVPLRLVEVVVSTQKTDKGKLKIIKTKRYNRTNLLD